MGILGARCPTCKAQLQINIPDDISNSYNSGVSTGVNMVINSIETTFPMLSFYNEVKRLNCVDADLAEFLHENIEEVKKKMEFPEIRLAKQWEDRKVGTDEYYVNNKDYLYDNAKYNKFPTYQVQRLLPLVLVRKQNTLDIGCGIGMLVSMLAGQDNNSMGYDINPMIIDFANFRKEKYGSNAIFTDKKPDFSKFDLITALGTFEHFENLEEFVYELGKTMKKGAKLYHYDDFGDQNISPMHFDYSENMDKWLDDSGFKRLNERWAIKL